MQPTTLQLAESLKGIEWDVQGFNAYPFFIDAAAKRSAFTLSWGLTYIHILAIHRGKNLEWHYDTADYRRIGELFWNRVHNVEELLALVTEYREAYASACRVAAYEEQALSEHSVAQLQDLLKKQVDKLCASGGIAHIIECATSVAEQKLLEYHIEPSTITASDMSFLKRAEIYAHELCSSEENDEEIVRKFKEKFAWMQSTYLGRNEVSLQLIRELSQKTITEEVLPMTYAEPEKQNFVDMLSHVFSWQDERKGNLLASVYEAQPVLEALAKKVGISSEAIKFLLPEEIESVTAQDLPHQLKERMTLFVNYSHADQERVTFVGAEAQQFMQAFGRAVQSAAEMLKGQTAFAGLVRGVVRVCLSLESIEQVKPGEILVASMTRPEYVPAMKRAAAFITDEGGITCHAAIIAREMNKPCIIGTKIATKILKDGDEVEVDATKGVVTILKRV